MIYLLWCLFTRYVIGTAFMPLKCAAMGCRQGPSRCCLFGWCRGHCRANCKPRCESELSGEEYELLAEYREERGLLQ